jgi:DNA-binding transcriptional ArsR family regulator
VAASTPRVTIDDPRYVKALAHPLRIRILAMLQERPASPVQIAHRVELPLGRVAHHVRVLRDLGMIQLEATYQRRGATEHVYRAAEIPRFSDGAWGSLGATGRERLLAALLGQIGDYVGGAATAGGFERPDANVSRVPLQLDERGWTELADAGKRWLAEADEIQADANARAERDPDVPRLDVGLVLLVFEAFAFSDR